MKRKHFEELDVLDQAHLDFLTAYDKQYLFEGRPAEAARLRTMGTVVGKHGIVVGYTSDGWERCLFEMEGEDVLLKTRNLRKRRSAPSVTLWKKASDHLMQNRFRLQTAEQRACYHQWLKTGRFSVEQAWKEIHQKEAEKMATEERRRMEQTHAEIRRQAIRSRRGQTTSTHPHVSSN